MTVYPEVPATSVKAQAIHLTAGPYPLDVPAAAAAAARVVIYSLTWHASLFVMRIRQTLRRRGSRPVPAIERVRPTGHVC